MTTDNSKLSHHAVITDLLDLSLDLQVLAEAYQSLQIYTSDDSLGGDRLSGVLKIMNYRLEHLVNLNSQLVGTDLRRFFDSGFND